MTKKSGEDVIDTKSAEEKLGPDTIESIAKKEWKTAPLPTEEDLAKEKHKSPKARSNVNSRKNLVQYNKNKTKETKKKVVEGLKFNEKREDVDPFDYISVPKDFDNGKLTAFLPPRVSFRSAQEEKSFYISLNAFLQDFDIFELSGSDVEDVVSLALNKILEARLLSASAEEPEDLMEVAQTMERFRKHSDKLKGNLASRRADRIDPKNKQNFSIIDIVYAYSDNKKEEYLDRVRKMEEENKEFIARKGKSK